MNHAVSRLGENIRAIRQRLKISQAELAGRAGLNRTYLSDVERGRRNLGFFALVAIARGLGITVSELTRNIGSGIALRHFSATSKSTLVRRSLLH